MTYYTYIKPTQQPFDAGMDSSNRRQFAFNVIAHKESSVTLLEELAKILQSAGVGSIHASGNPAANAILTTSGATLGTGDGPYLVIVETPGLGPDHTQNETSPPAYAQPGAQIMVTAKLYSAARAMAFAAYNAFCAVTNATVVP